MKIIIFFTTFLLSCQSHSNKKLDKFTSVDTSVNQNRTLSRINTDTSIINSVHFLGNCLELMSNSSVGSLAEIDKDKDSTGYLCFADCYDCKESYEIIFVYKGGVSVRKRLGFEGVSKEFDNGCNNNFKNFDCFAFVNPMRDPDKQKDEHAMNIDFPVTVKIYKRITGDTWEFVKKIKVKSFEEYQLVRFKTIYDIN